ncbi:MAG: DJ-1/PfpI family protein [Proteobacteria bacterium]|nr:DJ-1/PfpI family protein [Pseudomonadota bacterium]MBU1686842.1 DJ-1/PfpI family protein [Pseudomonadota bacterium]
MAVKVLIPLAAGGEELESVTMINLFRRAGFTVVSAGLDVSRKPVKCARGTVIIPDATLDECLHDEFDLVALPGGQPGTDTLRKDGRILKLVRDQVAAGRYMAAICAAPMVLGEADVLSGRAVTCYPGTLDGQGFSDIDFRSDPVVVDGKIVTSKGPGTALDFALTLIELLAGVDTRRKVEAGLQRC